MWILMSFLLIYEVQKCISVYNYWNSPQYRTNFQYCFWVATCYVCSWVKQRIYNKCLKNSQLFTSKSTVAEKYTHLLAFQISCSPSRKTCSPENFTCSLENFTCSPENFTCSPENFTCSPQHFTSSPVKFSYWPAQFNFPCAHLKLMTVQT